jgi:predicted phosphoribosyltransferase
MARVIADGLDGQLNVVLVHKLRAPFHPEVAIGAIDESGRIVVGDSAEAYGADSDYIQEEARSQLETIQRRRQLYTPNCKPISARDRLVIVVDDGIATGSTLLSALRLVRLDNPRRLVAAVGVAPTDRLPLLANEADEVVCGHHTRDFGSVGSFFQNFASVSDDDVVGALQTADATWRSHR